ncbi:3-methyladenine DNA glycosylase [Georgenia alba]|uniref:3-methyladenine DNA glycosylase n=1 Tax=Georgenia alba TaxID=2233858 RepID=A0ABW2Q7H1_9MICO
MPVPTTASLPALAPADWLARADRHAARADGLTAARRARRERRESDPVEDFLFEYYPVRPGRLRRWHPGFGAALGPSEGDDAAADVLTERAGWRWHSRTESGAVTLDSRAYLADREAGVRWLDELLRRTADRPAHLGCLGLHEWAMVYRQREHRHALPLRLGQAGTDTVVESHPVRCSHFDAFRFFTPEARPLNRHQPERATQPDLEQPGCLHANMDLLKAANILGPACPGELLLDCFELARDIRVLDMRASPYDLRALGHEPVTIETAEGRAEYVAAQRAFAERAAPLRARLAGVTGALLGGSAGS